MVDVDAGRSIFDLAGASAELEDLLGVPVDVLAGPSLSSANPVVARQVDRASIGLSCAAAGRRVVPSLVPPATGSNAWA